MPRPSPVRDALRQVFSSREHQALSLEELLEKVRSAIGAGDYSTVFRAVGVLEDEKVVQRVDLGDGLARYESRGEHHEHVRGRRQGDRGDHRLPARRPQPGLHRHLPRLRGDRREGLGNWHSARKPPSRSRRRAHSALYRIRGGCGD